MNICIATVTIDKCEAVLQLQDPALPEGPTAASTASRKLVAVFSDPKRPRREIAGVPGSELPKIKAGREGVKQVIRFVSSRYYLNGREPQWDQALWHDLGYSGCIKGSARANGMNPDELSARAKAAAEVRYTKLLPVIEENGPAGQRLRLTADKGPGRSWVVHFVLVAQDGTTHQLDLKASARKWAVHTYWLLLAYAGFDWKMPEGYRDQAFRKWFGKDIGSIVTLPNKGQKHV